MGQLNDNKMILIVDDENGIREMLKMAFEMHDFPVTVAANGQDALGLLEKIPKPGMIVLDLMMPVMGGKAFAQELALRESWKDIPIVVITAFPNQSNAIERAKAVLDKPLEFDALLDLAVKFCG